LQSESRNSENDSCRNFRPTATVEVLRRRAELLRRVRRFFDDRGFLEVETPLLSADTVIDLHLDPIPVTLFSDPRRPDAGQQMWLQTSPEFAMKRLLAAGAPSIYQVTRAFRGGEVGRWHNPEFTIVEWYGVDQGLQEGIQLLSDLAETLLEHGPAERISYQQAFQRWVGLDPHQADGQQLAAAAQRLDLAAPSSLATDDRDAGFPAGRMRRAATGQPAAGDPVRVSRQPSRVGSRPARKPGRCRTLRAVFPRGGVGKRLS